MADTNHFRKKPVVIQAIQWDGTLSGMDSILSSFNDIQTVAKTSHPPTNTCSFWKIGTLEGGHEVSAGDFIIRGVKGEYYPCKPDIFSMTYEPATATPPADAALADRLDAMIGDAESYDKVYLAQAAAALRARAVPDEPVESILAAYKAGLSHGKEQTDYEFEFAPGSASDKAYAAGYNEGYERRLATLAAKAKGE